MSSEIRVSVSLYRNAAHQESYDFGFTVDDRVARPLLMNLMRNLPAFMQVRLSGEHGITTGPCRDDGTCCRDEYNGRLDESVTDGLPHQ